jgi:hypothetical protein
MFGKSVEKDKMNHYQGFSEKVIVFRINGKSSFKLLSFVSSSL